MNLFNYLMNKKGKKLVDNDHMLEYLLNKGTTPEKEATGTNINITDVTKEKIIKLTLDKESTQDGTPSPENPVEVKTVKGYRNLFDKDNLTYLDNAYVSSNGVIGSDNRYALIYTYLKSGSYTISNLNMSPFQWVLSDIDSVPTLQSQANPRYVVNDVQQVNYTLNNDGYILIRVIKDTFSIQELANKLQIVEGTEELPYVSYGNNWVYTAVSNGTDTNYYTIPLNNNEITGIGNYKDELIVDRNGKCWLNKKCGKFILNGNETNWFKSSVTTLDRFIYGLRASDKIFKIDTNSLSNYFSYGTLDQTGTTIGKWTNNGNSQYVFSFSTYGTTTLEQFKEWLSNHNIILYQPLATEDLIDLNYTVDIRLFNGVNNISNSDDMNMTLIYK